jgi:2TM domain
VWAFNRDNHAGFWPIWTVSFWGLGIVVQAWHVYGGGRRPMTETDIQREVERGRLSNP